MDRRESLLGVTSSPGLLTRCSELPELSGNRGEGDGDNETAETGPPQGQVVRKDYRVLDAKEEQ
ncbi:hypothetical protein [Salinibaculum salinum]|uniref:hypothetical protein n=1 Tax=Salinibaculum salinum TaxID=3131996 RepID=UPI0030ED3521